MLVITHRSPSQPGGPTARWRSLVARLPDYGWQVEILSAPERESAVELSAAGSRAAERRASVMGAVGRAADPAFNLVGLRPDVVPLSMSWIPRGVSQARRRLASGRYDLVFATGPPMVALIVGHVATRRSGLPLILEFRDLWAGSPAFDRGGPLLPAVEQALLRSASRTVVMTPEAARDMQVRHPRLTPRIVEIPNGFEPKLLHQRPSRNETVSGRRITILHSGTLSPARPLTPLLDAMDADPRFELVLHGYVHPEIAATVEDRHDVTILPSSGWEDAVARMIDADACLVTQAADAGDATAVASKVYEYLALGRPVLCLTDGGATEMLLRRLGAEALAARLDDPTGIARALRHLAESPPQPVEAQLLLRYSRAEIARAIALLADDVCAQHVRDPR